MPIEYLGWVPYANFTRTLNKYVTIDEPTSRSNYVLHLPICFRLKNPKASPYGIYVIGASQLNCYECQVVARENCNIIYEKKEIVDTSVNLKALIEEFDRKYVSDERLWIMKDWKSVMRFAELIYK